MAWIKWATQAPPSAPASGYGEGFFDTSLVRLFTIDSTSRNFGTSHNASIASQGAGFATDTYVTNSNLIIPSFSMQAKTVFRWSISASKTAAGTAQPIYTVRIGANATTADTARLVLTGPAQTAVADIGTLEIMVTCRTVHASTGTIQGTAWWSHRGTASSSTGGTGFADDQTGHVEGTSAGFDNTVTIGGQYIGLSIDGGASASWTLTQCYVRSDW